MLLYDSIGPNPKVVRMFIAERGIAGIPTQTVDLRGAENRQEAYLAKNPTGGLPSLELDDGSNLAEITAICEYLDETASGPSLIGSTPQERAETRMWVRRIDLGLKMFAPRMRCIPQAADDLKLMAAEKLAWLDGQMAGKTFICGDRFTLADIFLFAFLQFGATVRQPVDPSNTNLIAWYDRMAERPSAAV